MVIERPGYLRQLASRMHNGMIKVITGMRRSGKSFLLFELFCRYLHDQGVSDDQIIRVDLEDFENRELRSAGRLYAFLKDRISQQRTDRRFYVLIDEVQYAISREDLKNRAAPLPLYDVLNSLLHQKMADVYVTGSNSKFLSSDVLTEFRGRGDQILVQPLSFSEFFTAAGGDDSAEALEAYLFYGGMPHILSEPDAEGKSRYLNGLFTEILMKDIRERHSLANGSGMNELVQVIASSVGSLTNPNRLANTFASSGQKGVSAPVIADYLNYLQDSFIVRKAARYDVKGKKYITTPAKYYFTDVGIRNACLNFRQVEETHLMENVIFNELISRGFDVDVGVIEVNAVEQNKHVRKQLEVDFVASKGSSRYYIQSAFAIDTREKTEQEQRGFRQIQDSFKKILVTRENRLPWHTDAGVLVIGLERFLLEPGSMDL